MVLLWGKKLHNLFFITGVSNGYIRCMKPEKNNHFNLKKLHVQEVIRCIDVYAHLLKMNMCIEVTVIPEWSMQKFWQCPQIKTEGTVWHRNNVL